MRSSELYRQLAVNRELIEAAAARFAKLAEGLDHPRIDTTRDSLTASCIALTHAAGGLSRWIATPIATVLLGIAVWSVAAVASGPLDLSSGWVIAAGSATSLAVCWPAAVLMDRVSNGVNRRRTTRSSQASAVEAPVGSDAPTEILVMLREARDSLLEIMRNWSGGHRFGQAARTAAGFDWLRQHDRHLFWISVADRSICRAIDSIEIWHISRRQGR